MIGVLVLLTALLTSAQAAGCGPFRRGTRATGPPSGVSVVRLFLRSVSAQTVLKQSDLVEPAAVAKEIQSKNPPTVLFVGFPVLYRSTHIPGAIMAGPCSTPEGLQKLKEAVSSMPKDKPLVLYCGCCPMVKCPNVKPAYAALHELGFTQLRVIELDTNFHTDWVQKGYPTERRR